MTRRTLTKPTATVVVVVVLRQLVGVWLTAAMLAGLAVVGLVAGWAAIERRAFPGRPPPRHTSVIVGHQPGDGARHVAFARALAVVAAAYLTDCERDERQEMGR